MNKRLLFSRLFATAARSLTFAGLAGLLSICNLGIDPVAYAAEAVLTHHDDNGRTGWNSHETTLTPTNVASSNFHALLVVQLDDQVDAQPLVAPGLQRNLGAPVPMPSNRNQNGPNVGIMGTPVIVQGRPSTMYLVTYTVENGADGYRNHTLGITTLSDRVPSVVVTASHSLTGVTPL